MWIGWKIWGKLELGETKMELFEEEQRPGKGEEIFWGRWYILKKSRGKMGKLEVKSARATRLPVEKGVRVDASFPLVRKNKLHIFKAFRLLFFL